MTGAYPSALDAGMTPKEFWESTVAEIRDRLESWGRRETARIRERAVMDYRLAALISSACFGKMPRPHEAYPGIFEPPDEIQDWRIMKERLSRYAAAHNRKRAVNHHDD